ncbi:MAG: hypothetical protein R3D43_15110 [Tepidamorphaceae bacterium]
MNVPLSEPAVKDGKAVQEIDLQSPGPGTSRSSRFCSVRSSLPI